MFNLENIKNIKNSNVGFFRFKKIDSDCFLITNDIGRYSYLNKEEFGNFISGKLNSGEKYEELLNSGFIKNESFQTDMAVNYARKNNYLAYGPVLHIMVVTLRCNHKCKYCHAAAAPTGVNNMDMTEDIAKKTVDAIFYTSSPNITIEFQGGEPLLNWDIIKYIIEYAEIKSTHLSKNVTFALVTNLTLMDEEKLNYLLEHSVHISTSLDGDEVLHNENRGYKDGNSFKEVTRWINRINQEYEKRGIYSGEGEPIKVGALLTTTKNTLSRYKEVIDTYVNLGLDGIFLRPLNPYGFAASDVETLGYSAEEFGAFYKNAMDYIMELNKKGTKFREMTANIYLHKILLETDPNYLDQRSPCGAAIGQVAYNYDGNVYTCDEGRMLARMGDDSFFLTNVKENGQETYNNIIDNEVTKVMVQASTLDGLPGYNESVYKPYLGVCPINSYKTTGNIIPNYAKDYKRKLDCSMLDYIFEKLRNQEDKKVFEYWLGIL